MKTKEEIEQVISLIEGLVRALEQRPDDALKGLIRQKKGEIQALRWVLGEWEQPKTAVIGD